MSDTTQAATEGTQTPTSTAPESANTERATHLLESLFDRYSIDDAPDPETIVKVLSDAELIAPEPAATATMGADTSAALLGHNFQPAENPEPSPLLLFTLTVQVKRADLLTMHEHLSDVLTSVADGFEGMLFEGKHGPIIDAGGTVVGTWQVTA